MATAQILSAGSYVEPEFGGPCLFKGFVCKVDVRNQTVNLAARWLDAAISMIANKWCSTPLQTQLCKAFPKSLSENNSFSENTMQQMHTAPGFSQAFSTSPPSGQMSMAPASNDPTRVGADDPNLRESPVDVSSISMEDPPPDSPSNGESSSGPGDGSGGQRPPYTLEIGDLVASQNRKAGIVQGILVLGVELFELVINLVSQQYVSQSPYSKILQYFAWSCNLIGVCLGVYVIQFNIRNRGVAPPIIVKTACLVAALGFVADIGLRLSDELMLWVFGFAGMLCITGFIAC